MRVLSLNDCDEAARLLASGAVGVIPTDTVYGLAAHPNCPAAIQRLYAVKGRDAAKPIAFLASDADAIARFGFPILGKAAEMAREGWPGPLTLVVENPSGLAEGFRVPAHDWTRLLIAKCGGLLRVTSANLSGLPPATTPQAAIEQLGDKIDFIVDDGPSPIGAPSRVVRVSHSGQTFLIRE